MVNFFADAFAIGAGLSAGAAVPWVILSGSVVFAVTGTIATIDVMTHNFVDASRQISSIQSL